MPTNFAANVLHIVPAERPTSRRSRLTKAVVDALPFCQHGQVIYWDSAMPSFGVRVGQQSKTYIAEGRVKGRTCRVKIGRHGPFHPDTARTAAREILVLMSRGIDPNVKKKRERSQTVTLQNVFDAYLLARTLRPLTILDYTRLTNECFKDWLNHPITHITKDMVERRHLKIGQRGHTQANNSMRVLRALFNFAIAKYEDEDGNSLIRENPVKRISQIRAWYRTTRRKTVIRPHELGPWINAVIGLPDAHHNCGTVVRDYLLFLIFTGLRRSEAAQMKWDDVDFRGKYFTVRDTKNHDDHTIPLTAFLVELLQSRRQESEDEYVFPGIGKNGFFTYPRRQMLRITRETGITFVLHDLRRTFTTVAESLDIPAYALKRLLNHRMTNDVTAGYIIADPERLREPMERICKFMLEKAGLTTEQAIERLKVGNAN